MDYSIYVSVRRGSDVSYPDEGFASVELGSERYGYNAEVRGLVVDTDKAIGAFIRDNLDSILLVAEAKERKRLAEAAEDEVADVEAE